MHQKTEMKFHPAMGDAEVSKRSLASSINYGLQSMEKTLHLRCPAHHSQCNADTASDAASTAASHVVAIFSTKGKSTES